MTCHILVTRPGAVAEQDKATLRECGVVVVETDNLANIRLLQAEPVAVNASGMLWAAVDAIQKRAGTDTKAQFVENLAKQIKKPDDMS